MIHHFTGSAAGLNRFFTSFAQQFAGQDGPQAQILPFVTPVCPVRADCGTGRGNLKWFAVTLERRRERKGHAGSCAPEV